MILTGSGLIFDWRMKGLNGCRLHSLAKLLFFSRNISSSAARANKTSRPQKPLDKSLSKEDNYCMGIWARAQNRDPKGLWNG